MPFLCHRDDMMYECLLFTP